MTEDILNLHDLGRMDRLFTLVSDIIDSANNDYDFIKWAYTHNDKDYAVTYRDDFGSVLKVR